MNSFQGSNSYLKPNVVAPAQAVSTSVAPASPTNSFSGASSLLGGTSSLGGFNSATSKLLSNQNIDPTIASMLGDQITTYNGQKYYTGKTDPSGYQWGTTGLNTKDLGNGTYDILGSTGSIGTGYKDLASSIGDIAYQNALKSAAPYQYTQSSAQPTNLAAFGNATLARAVQASRPTPTVSQGWTSALFDETPTWTNYDPEGNPVTVTEPTIHKYFGSQAEVEAAMRALTNSRVTPNYQAGGKLSQWEALGQLLNNSVGNSSGDPLAKYREILGNNFGGAAGQTGMTGNQWGGLPGNMTPETIKGLQTLYGSDPLIYKGGAANSYMKAADPRLLGYRVNLGPGDTVNVTGSGGQDIVTGNPYSYNASHNGKSHSWNASLARSINDPTAYSSLVSSLGGNNVFVTPENAAKLPGWTNYDNFKHVDKDYSGMGGIDTLVSAIAKFTPAAPFAYAYDAYNALNSGNYLGAAMAALGGFGGLDSLSASLSKSAGIPLNTAKALVAGGSGGLSALGGGGSFGKGFAAGALGSYGGSLGGRLGGSLGGSVGAGIGAGLGSGVGSSIGSGKFNPQALALNSLLGGLRQYNQGAR